MYTGSQKSHNPYNRSRFNGKKKFFHNGKRNKLAEKIEESKFIRNTVTPSVEEAYVVKHAFTDFPITETLKNNIAFQKYTIPTPIQDQAIQPILEGRDVIGIANTGTGKTAAFLIPLIDKVAKNKNEKILIIAPTRELALQIKTELQKFSRGLGVHAILCIGGASVSMQRNELRRNPHFVIGTPGRLKDLIEHRALDLSKFHNIVLDEVDRMVDIGFIKDISYLISLMPQERQSLFFSATVSPEVNSILQKFVKNPVTVAVRTRETSENIQQDIIRVKDKDKKIEQLQELLQTTGFDKVIVFGKTKWGIQKLTNALIQKGFKAAAIHGNKSQGQRQYALDQFKTDKIQVLLATDVASRGLDIPDVTHVINYDTPASYDDYIHRIGRTGRADKKGVALTFVD
ncbi:MAG TPA: DEAD/DEAH box helicase [Candidatus Saccharimonadales bacterium]|nr:DEAD/DEAH box helicase [Candidatus Saccharimonadales bacterium]